MTKSRNINAPRKWWTEADVQLLRDRYPNTKTSVLADLLDRDVKTVHHKAQNLGIKKSRATIAQMAREAMADPQHPGRTVQFKPGGVPHNKGIKHPKGWAPGNMAATQFKPGDKPHTWLPVGTYAIDPDGSLTLKVNDLPGPKSVRWRQVHRMVWEAANGPTPDGCVVVFKPGRKTTDRDLITIDAVECITRVELMQRNTLHRMPKPLAELVQLRGVLTRQINRKAKEAKTT